MLRNRLTCIIDASSAVRRHKSSGSTNAARQSRILGKLFGSRVAGTKKRWYPSHEQASGSGSGSYQPPSLVFQASQFGKSSASGGVGSKQSTRRMSVLNKLFMTHITDLLATGEAADTVLGRGLQVSRVKISSDFSCINVYWLGNGDGHSDATLEQELQRSSGQLRHELSQLRLMGEVPRIKFVRDKTGSNINNVENILRGLNLPKMEQAEEREGEQEQHHYDVAQTVRQEFYGNVASTATPTTVPQMRHDVLGLDHHLIMDKILGKMRKTKIAWEQHQQQVSNPTATPTSSSDTLQRLQQKCSDLSTSEHSKFENFLSKRRERKQTPERKKHRRDELDIGSATAAANSDYDELHHEHQEDFILEEESKDKPHNFNKS